MKRSAIPVREREIKTETCTRSKARRPLRPSGLPQHRDGLGDRKGAGNTHPNLDNLADFRTGFVQDGLQIVDASLGLLGDGAFDQVAILVGGDLSGAEDEACGFDRLAVRASSWRDGKKDIRSARAPSQARIQTPEMPFPAQAKLQCMDGPCPVSGLMETRKDLRGQAFLVKTGVNPDMLAGDEIEK